MTFPIRFSEVVGNINIVHRWCLFIVPETITLLEKFDGIYSGKYSYSRELLFESYNT